MSKNKGVGYSPKSYQSETFTWYPDRSVKRNTGGVYAANKKKGCTATAGSQGEDWNTSYSYNITVSQSGVQQRIAYMACDYAQ